MKEKEIRKAALAIAALEKQKNLGEPEKLIEEKIQEIVGNLPEKNLLGYLLAIDDYIQKNKLC